MKGKAKEISHKKAERSLKKRERRPKKYKTDYSPPLYARMPIFLHEGQSERNKPKEKRKK